MNTITYHAVLTDQDIECFYMSEEKANADKAFFDQNTTRFTNVKLF